MRLHPYCELFPAMEGDELRRLADDIKANTQREMIYTLDGMILDGRNRFAACELAKVTPKVIPYDGKDPLAFVLSKNLHRRHLTESQRAILAAELANLSHGGTRKKVQDASLPLEKTPEERSQKTPKLPDVSQDEAAVKLDVSRRSVTDAAKVLNEGDEEVIDAVKRGAKSVSKAAKEIREKAKDKPAAKDEAPANPLAEAAEAFCQRLNGYTRQLDTWASEFAELKADPLAHHVHWETVLSQLTAVRKAIHQGRPRRRCPYCKATGRKGKEPCKSCKGTGHVCESIYRSGCAAVGVPEEEGDE